VLVVAATDRRVKCVVSQVPTISGYKNTLRSIPTDKFDAFLAELNEDRLNRAKGLPPKMVPISTEGSESYAWSIVAGKGTGYVNSVTLRTNLKNCISLRAATTNPMGSVWQKPPAQHASGLLSIL
jgi:hypothetical protein